MHKPLLRAVLFLFTLTIIVSTQAQVGGGPLSITCPPDLVLLTCSNSAVGHFEVTASGNNGPVVCAPPSGSEFSLGVTSVTCTATDSNGGGTQCSFAITVKQPPSRWPCPAKELGLGIPFETVGGAVSVVRPGPGLGNPGISIFPNAADPESGIVLQPGEAQIITFTTVLDFTAPVGSGFDIVLPPDPAHPNDPPILSFARKSGPKGYCVKANKRYADDPTTTSRVLVVNSNGAVLPPLEFTTAEIEANGVFDIGFQPGVTNCHVTIELNCQDGSVSVEFPGPIVQSSSRKGWDGCIYGPDRPVKKPTSRVSLIPPVIPGLPPIMEARARISGWTEMPIEEPSTTSMGRKWGDGHVTLMKAYDDGEGMEFVSLAPGGGIHADLGDSTSFEMRFSHFDDPSGTSSPEQTLSIRGGRWPIGLTNRPPPPPIDVRLAPGPAGVDCSADYTLFGFSNITVQVWSGGVLVQERNHLPGQINTPFASLSEWPFILGCPGVGVVRLAHTNPLAIFWIAEGWVSIGDELRIIPELPPGEVLPATFSQIECRSSDGLQGLLYGLQSTPATPVDPLSITCPSNVVTSATSSAGSLVNYVPFLHVGECVAFPYPNVVCTPETGSVFPVGTTTVSCSVTNGCGELAACSFSITVDQRPVILAQPVSLVVTAGQPAHLSAEAYSGPAAFYRWEIFCPPTRPDFPFCGCLPLQTWRPLCLGCPPPFVDFPSVTAECGSGYYLVVSNDFGVVTSEVANITVVPALNCQDLVFLTCSNGAVGYYQVGVNGQQGTVVCTPPSGSTFPLGVTPVTCVATNYSGGLAECSFSVTVKQASASWACNQVGIGIPFEPVGGATALVRPEISDRGPAIVVTPEPGNTQSGVLLSPGPARAITFTVLLDFTTPAGSGFDLVLPPDPLHPGEPPILSMHRKSGPKGYCVKTSTKLYDDAPGTEYRAYVVNTNGDLLDPLTFSSAEIHSDGVFDINFQPGISNSYVTVQVDLLDGTISVEYPGPTTPSTLRKGWDGCIYGNGTPSKGTKGQTSRVIVKPYSPTYPPPPPITALFLYSSGWPTVTVEDPSITSSGRKWGDGHVTLMKAYDDGESGLEFRSFAPGGGVHVDLGHSESFRVKLTKFENGDVPTEDQLLTRTIGPIRGLTNRPPPPFLDALLLKGPTNAVDCSADFNNLDSPTVHVLLYHNGVMVAQRSGVPGQLDHILFTLPSWPETLSKLSGATPCRRGTIKLGTVRLPGGAGIASGIGDEFIDADEFRVLAELPPGAPHPDFYSGFEFISNDGPTWRVSNLERTLICTPEPLILDRGTDVITFSWSGEGFRLEGAATVSGPWFDLGVASPVILNSNHAARFFRLVCD